MTRPKPVRHTIGWFLRRNVVYRLSDYGSGNFVRLPVEALVMFVAQVSAGRRYFDRVPRGRG